MGGRWLTQLPWMAAMAALGLVVAVQGFVLQPLALDRARGAALEAIRETAARDTGFIQAQVFGGRLDEVRDFVSATATLPGLEAIVLVSPSGEVLASGDMANEGRPLDAGTRDRLTELNGGGAYPVAPAVARLADSNVAEVVSAVRFPLEGAPLRAVSDGAIYQRWNLDPAVRPVLDASRFFMLAATILIVLFAVPLQAFVHLLVNRRLRRLARDVAHFSAGERAGLFEDPWDDDIGRIFSVLREAAQVLAGREEATQRLALALESANAGIWDWNMRGDQVHTGAQYHTMFGDAPVDGPIPSATILERLHPDDYRRIRGVIRTLHEPGNDTYQVEFRMRGASSGEYLWIRSTGRVVERALDGTAARMLGQHVDITAQRALQAREADLARIVDESLNEIYIFSAVDYHFIHVNRAACVNLGYTMADLARMSLVDLKPEYTFEQFNSVVAPLRVGEEEIVRLETVHRRKDGSTYEVEAHIQAHTQQEEPAFVAVVLDITERKAQERALRASEARFRVLVEQAADAVFLLDAQGGFVDVNAEACRSTGYARDELLARAVRDLIPRLSEGRLTQFITSLEPGKPILLESQHKRKDGMEFPVEIRIAVYDFEGARRVIAVARDISERKAVEARNRLHEARIRKFFEGVGHAITVFDRDGRCVMLNSIAAGKLGAPASEIVGRTVAEILPRARRVLSERIAQILAQGRLLEWEDAVQVRGEERWFHTIMQPMEDDAGDSDWVMVTSYDITDRKKSEEHARAQDARYRTLVESTSAILWEADPATFQMTFVNQEAEAVLGYPAAAWIETRDFWQNHIHPRDREWVVAKCQQVTERCENHSFEYRMIRADGTIVWLRDIVNVLARDGKPEKIVGVMIDITREKQEEERFQAAFESIPIGNIVIDDTGVIMVANPAAQEMFGYSAERLQGSAMAELIPTAPWDAIAADFDSAAHGGSGELVAMKEYTGLRANREGFPLRLAVGEMRREGARTYVCSVIDLSHVKSLEAQLAQSQRMEAVGQLAGGIAHDFNNLLHVINGFVEIARQAQPKDAPVQVELEQIALAGQRAAALTSQLLAFSRRQVMKPQSMDLNDVVSRTATLLGRVIGEHIRLEVLAGQRLSTIYADQGMMEQVLMNLCVNARDAMKEGGQLTIETENVVINGTYSQDHLWARPGRYVLLTVTDTGCGMDAGTASRVFEPFFTTKGLHEGTGLGLSTVYGIVKQHGGMINVYSEVGKGSSFKVYLPQSERAAGDVGTKIEGTIPKGTETILVVEDDDAVRQLTRAILESGGYNVLEAPDGRKAVRCYRERRREIHLVLLDVIMPDMGGREALDEMLKIEPGVKALFASGYSENAIHTNFVLDQGLALLKKPYSRSELLHTIRALLDRAD